MPWRKCSAMESAKEFVQLAVQEGANKRELCRRAGVTPTTGYRWLRRFQQEGMAGLQERSRRPHSSPFKTPSSVEEAAVRLRQEHPAWGSRKLQALLLKRLKPEEVPSPTTITRILQRHQLLNPQEARHHAFIRFEAPFPNALWQMDYKGHFALASSARCHPLTVLDDHTRFDIGLRALPDERTSTVKAELVRLFQRYGLPNRILCDNSAPWGHSGTESLTSLAVWLLHLDVIAIHGRPWHPQTQGKDERFHRTLKRELLSTRTFATLDEAQSAFDGWRDTYNQVRPHEALGFVPPITRYQSSPRSYPERLPEIDYQETDLVRMVGTRGTISLNGHRYYVGEGFYGYPVALRPNNDEVVWNVFFRHYCVSRIDLRVPAGQ